VLKKKVSATTNFPGLKNNFFLNTYGGSSGYMELATRTEHEIYDIR